MQNAWGEKSLFRGSDFLSLILEYFNIKQIKQISIDEIEKQVDVKPEYKKIYKVIQKGEIHINQISKETKINIGELNSKLLMMELEGLIESKPGNNYEVE